MYLLHRWYRPKAVGVLSVRDTGDDPIDWHSEVVTSAHDRPDIRLCTRVMIRARPSWCIQIPGAVVRKRIPEVRVVVLDMIIENLQQPVADLEDAANRNIVCGPWHILEANELLTMVVVITSRWCSWGRDPSLRCCCGSSVITSTTTCPLSGRKVAVSAGSDSVPLFGGNVFSDVTNWRWRRRPRQQDTGLVRFNQRWLSRRGGSSSALSNVWTC